MRARTVFASCVRSILTPTQSRVSKHSVNGSLSVAKWQPNHRRSDGVAFGGLGPFIAALKTGRIAARTAARRSTQEDRTGLGSSKYAQMSVSISVGISVSAGGWEGLVAEGFNAVVVEEFSAIVSIGGGIYLAQLPFNFTSVRPYKPAAGIVAHPDRGRMRPENARRRYAHKKQWENVRDMPTHYWPVPSM